MNHYLILSDDLTGANGVSGMARKFSFSATTNSMKIINNFKIITINTVTRSSDPAEAKNKIDLYIELFNKNRFYFGKRVDSTLRGNIEDEALPILKYYSIVYTNTIPEYNRYTENGNTIFNNQIMSLKSIFKKIKTKVLTLKDFLINEENENIVYIVDSKTYDDLKVLAKEIVKRKMVPMDPGPLIAEVARVYLKVKDLALPDIKVKGNIAFVVGSTQPQTIKQIEYARKYGINVKKINDLGENLKGDVVIHFDLMKEKEYLNDSFINLLNNYDAIFVSGGETGNILYDISRIDYIESLGQFYPLVGIGKIKGGILDNKIIITKGGMIGNENIYVEIIKKLKEE